MSNQIVETDGEVIQNITIPSLGIKKVIVSVEGMHGPLVVHRFSEKAKKQIQEAEGQKAKKGRTARIPKEEFEAAMHRLPDGGHGFPAGGVRKAMIRAAKGLNIAMTDAANGFFILGDQETDLVTLILDEAPEMREDMVRLKGSNATMRYRPGYNKWGIDLTVEFNPAAFSAEQIVLLVQAAGFGVGLGESRPDKKGQWGRFQVTAV